ncbi:DMT family transporter [Niallia sp. 01092]|uniref:DMT family transporter n=1 Tax=unclassified Niallia TaxID=2837522 RepID=UPI003FD44464
MIVFLYSVMCFIFGTTFLAIKVGIDAGFPPFLSAGIRFLLAGSIIFCYFSFKNRNILRLLLCKELIITGFSLTFITFASLYWAEQYVTSGIAAILSATGPMLIIVLQSIFLKKQTTKISILGISIGFIGVLFLFLPGLSIDVSTKWIFGCGIILLGEIGYAAGTIYSSKVIATFQSQSPIVLNAVQMIYGGLFLLLIAVFTMESIPSLKAEGIISVIYLTVAGSMLGHTIYYYLVAKTNTFIPSTWLYVSPVIALTIGRFFYNEYFHPIMLIGAFFIISSLVLINLSKITGYLTEKKILSAK